jgi:hypothetical protein
MRNGVPTVHRGRTIVGSGRPPVPNECGFHYDGVQRCQVRLGSEVSGDAVLQQWTFDDPSILPR